MSRYSQTYYGPEASLLLETAHLEQHLVPLLKKKIDTIQSFHRELYSLFDPSQRFQLQACHIERKGKFCLVSSYLEQNQTKCFFSIFANERFSLKYQIDRFANLLYHCTPIKAHRTRLQDSNLPLPIQEHILRLRDGNDYLPCIIPDQETESNTLFHSINFEFEETALKTPGVSVLFGYQFV